MDISSTIQEGILQLREGDGDKRPKSEVNYQSSPNDDAKCGHCKFFDREDQSRTMKSFTDYMMLEGYSYDVLFHLTNYNALLDMLSKGKIQLSVSIGTSVERAINGKFYYLSTSRTPLNDYARRNTYGTGVMLVLNRRQIDRKYKTFPVDYWERSLPDNDEAEERVISDRPFLPFSLVEEVHILFDKEKVNHDKLPVILRKALIEAKRKRVPLYIYTDKRQFLILNKRKSVTVDDIIDDLAGPIGTGRSRKPTNFLEPYLELYYKRSKRDLSKRASSLAYDLKYGGYKQDVIRGLETEIHNTSRPARPELQKLLQIFRELRVRTVEEFLEKMAEKWKNL